MAFFNYTPSFLESQKNNHIGLFYDSNDEKNNISANFIEKGLEKNKKCIYITSGKNIKKISSALYKNRCRPQKFQDKNQLEFNRARDTYLQNGTFQIANMIKIITDSLNRAKKEGFSGLRGLAEMNWILEKNISLSKIKKYETRLNKILKDKDITLLCQYKFKKFPPQFIKNMVLIHPYVIHTRM